LYPKKREMEALRHCAGPKHARDKPPDELARIVIDNAMSGD
jgi:hypothetical protein